ncbi:MAG: DUF3800 domain-containing protein [Blautia sp.]|nr:DUF3800 domain-containing protein [Blautia sp.]
MDIYVYSDESGVFDKFHNRYFVFGGIIFLDKGAKEICSRKYSKAENEIRKSAGYMQSTELKANFVTNKEKGKLFRSLNQYIKFAVIISQNSIYDRIFESAKDKQRYLDFAFKIALKRTFVSLINEGKILPTEVNNVRCWIDEHTTATNGKYELREALEQEFKLGTYNYDYSRYYDPIFPNIDGVELHFCDSKSAILVRCADIIANRIYHLIASNDINKLQNIHNLYFSYLP